MAYAGRSALEQLADLLDGLAEPEPFTGSVVELSGDPVQVLGAVHRQVGAFRKVLAQQAVEVLVRAALKFSFVPRCQGECGSQK